VAKNLSSAPVTVTVTTGSVANALVVPVAALVARSGGGYAVEVTGPGGHHLVKVTVGLFDDAAGVVQVTGNLAPGQHVVVPAL
jgi:multidrug efflux pump subunit AcrA (membrane-fusion protein)